MSEGSHGLHHSQKDPDPLGWSLTNEPYRTIASGPQADLTCMPGFGFPAPLQKQILALNSLKAEATGINTHQETNGFYIRSHLGPQVPGLSSPGPSSTWRRYGYLWEKEQQTLQRRGD